MGDVTITWERSKAFEFSFFTLADSGAFVTHAPKRLNEALVLVRPFRWEVWPLLLFTIVISGPAFYLIIAVPFWWQKENNVPYNRFVQIRHHDLKKVQDKAKVKIRNYKYIMEMSYGYKNLPHQMKKQKVKHLLPENLLGKCVWFTLTLFLKQCK